MPRVNPKMAARVCTSTSLYWDRPKKLPGMYFSLQPNLKRPRVASTFRVIPDPKHNLSARMMRRCLSLRRDRFTQRENLRHDRFDLSRVDQLGDLCEVCCIRVNRNCRSMNSAFREFRPIGKRDQ